MNMKNFTVTFTLNDEPTENWAESFGISVEELAELMDKAVKGAHALMQSNYDKGEEATDGAQLIVHLMENDLLDPRVFIVVFHKAFHDLINPNPMNFLRRMLNRDDLSDD